MALSHFRKKNMHLFEKLEPLIKRGLELTFTLTADGDKMSLAIAPSSQPKMETVALPAQVLTATGAEFDAELETFMEQYVKSVENIESSMQTALSALKSAEASAIAATTAMSKSSTKAATTTGKSKTAPKMIAPSSTSVAEGGGGADDEDDDVPSGKPDVTVAAKSDEPESVNGSLFPTFTL